MPQLLRQAAEAFEGLQLLNSKDEAAPFLPYKTKLQIATRIRLLAADAQHYSTERFELAKKHGRATYKPQTKEQIASKAEPEFLGYEVAPSDPGHQEFLKEQEVLLAAEGASEPIKPLAAESLGENYLPVRVIMALQDAGVLAKEPLEG